MSFETEKIITLLNKFLDEHEDKYQNDEEAIAAFQMQYNLNMVMDGGYRRRFTMGFARGNALCKTRFSKT